MDRDTKFTDEISTTEESVQSRTDNSIKFDVVRPERIGYSNIPDADTSNNFKRGVMKTMAYEDLQAGQKIPQKYFGVVIDTSPSGSTRNYKRLGKDLESLYIALNPNVETSQNVLGETNNDLTNYDSEIANDTFIARMGDEIFEFVYDVAKNRKILDDAKTSIVELNIFESATNFTAIPAIREEVIIIPQQYGVDTSTMQVPFNLKGSNIRTEGTFDLDTGEFTAS